MKHVEHDLYKKKIYISPNTNVSYTFNEQELDEDKSEYMCMLRANRKYRVIASTDTHCTILSEEEGVTITLFRPLNDLINNTGRWANTTTSGVAIG